MDFPRKDYPRSYPHDVLQIINTMSFNKGRDVKIMGSMALRSQLYAADYDCYENIHCEDPSDKHALTQLVRSFQKIVKQLHALPSCFLTDIKAGSIEEWRILPEKARVHKGKVIHLNIQEERRKIEQLEKHKILSRDEADAYLEKMTKNLSPEEFVIIKKDMRPNIVRWNASDVEKGFKILKDGRTYTLEEAFSSPVITKLDLIGWVEGNRFAEFSMIYKFFNNRQPLNLHSDDVEQALKESILYFSLSNRWFKVAKRMFSYARFHDDLETMRILTPFLNSDLGRLYVILSDIQTILILLDGYNNVPKSKVVFELDQLRGRFANIYAIPGFLKLEFQVIKLLDSVLKESKKSIVENIGLVQDLNNIANLILNILNNESEMELTRLGFLPMPKKYLL